MFFFPLLTWSKSSTWRFVGHDDRGPSCSSVRSVGRHPESSHSRFDDPSKRRPFPGIRTPLLVRPSTSGIRFPRALALARVVWVRTHPFQGAPLLCAPDLVLPLRPGAFPLGSRPDEAIVDEDPAFPVPPSTWADRMPQLAGAKQAQKVRDGRGMDDEDGDGEAFPWKMEGPEDDGETDGTIRARTGDGRGVEGDARDGKEEARTGRTRAPGQRRGRGVRTAAARGLPVAAGALPDLADHASRAQQVGGVHAALLRLGPARPVRGRKEKASGRAQARTYGRIRGADRRAALPPLVPRIGPSHAWLHGERSAVQSGAVPSGLGARHRLRARAQQRGHANATTVRVDRRAQAEARDDGEGLLESLAGHPRPELLLHPSQSTRGLLLLGQPGLGGLPQRGHQQTGQKDQPRPAADSARVM
eukprot:scaffold73_cov337-Pavlova_lutheri.AAC.7